jgi:threonine dehydratase
VQVETPLEHAKELSAKTKNDIWLKREDLRPVFSFKLRGAFNKMASLSADQLRAGVICSSAGNHAQGVSLAAQHLGTSAVICMPVNTPQIKVQSSFGPVLPVTDASDQVGVETAMPYRVLLAL